MGRVESYCCDICDKVVNGSEKMWREFYEISVSGGGISGGNYVLVCTKCGDNSTIKDLRYKIESKDID